MNKKKKTNIMSWDDEQPVNVFNIGISCGI